MARTTNSDTLPFVDSRYELGMLASQRVRDLTGGAEPLVNIKNDKMTVVALREIASGKLDVENTRHEFVQSYRETPANADAESLEIEGGDPTLRELDAELSDILTEELSEELSESAAPESLEEDALETVESADESVE